MTTSARSPSARLCTRASGLATIGGDRGQPKLGGDRECSLGDVDADRARPERRGCLQGMDADASEPDHDRDGPGRDAAARRHRPVGGPERAGQRCRVNRVDLVGHDDQTVERRDDPALKAPRRREPRPALRVLAELLEPGAASTAPAARPQVVDDHDGARVERRRVAADHPSADLVAGDVGESEPVAERHPAARRLQVGEADPAGQDLEQRVPRTQHRLGKLDRLQWIRVVADRHPQHAQGRAAGAP